MIRGILAIITDNGKMYQSTEFNGGMDLGQNGVDAIKCLENVDTEDDFEDAIRTFDDEHHQYNDEQMVWEINDIEPFLDLTKDYFEHWGSDYVYIKNLSDEPVTVICKGNKTEKIFPYSIAVFYFDKHLITDLDTELYEKISEEYASELNNDDILAIVDNERGVCGIYEDTYDIGKEWACEVYGIDKWLDNDRYVNFENIGEDVIEDGAWLKLPSGKYAHLS